MRKKEERRRKKEEMAISAKIRLNFEKCKENLNQGVVMIG
jgi:hypothetical protein